MGLGTGLGGIASGVAGLFGGKGKNPADVANGYLGQIPGMTNQYSQPWIEAGQNQLPWLQQQYQQGAMNPGGKYNEIGQQFHESPGFQWALQQALQGNAHAEAAGGMAGSPQHERENMQTGMGLANQDYYNWMNGATGIYGNAMQGGQNMANQGQTAAQARSDLIAQMLAQQGKYGYEGQASKNASKNSSIGQIAGGIGSLFF